MRVRQFRSEFWLARPPVELFPFFADATNLETLTPQWLRFRIVTPRPIEMREGTSIDYHLRIHGLPVRWRSRINVWEPPHRFVDEQIRGPYRLWIHEHKFAERDGGTEVRDRVQYSAPGGALVDALFVRRDLEKIFAYRRNKLKEVFA
jgi:hypothetical protein